MGKMTGAQWSEGLHYLPLIPCQLLGKWWFSLVGILLCEYTEIETCTHGTFNVSFHFWIIFFLQLNPACSAVCFLYLCVVHRSPGGNTDESSTVINTSCIITWMWPQLIRSYMYRYIFSVFLHFWTYRHRCHYIPVDLPFGPGAVGTLHTNPQVANFERCKHVQSLQLVQVSGVPCQAWEFSTSGCALQYRTV